LSETIVDRDLYIVDPPELFGDGVGAVGHGGSTLGKTVGNPLGIWNGKLLGMTKGGSVGDGEGGGAPPSSTAGPGRFDGVGRGPGAGGLGFVCDRVGIGDAVGAPVVATAGADASWAVWGCGRAVGSSGFATAHVPVAMSSPTTPAPRTSERPMSAKTVPGPRRRCADGALPCGICGIIGGAK
jgi:hypothetical protein